MTNAPTLQNEKATVDKKLDDIGAEFDVLRKQAEGNTDYAERLIYELSVYVEDVWAVQDRIRDLVSASEPTS